jgi:short-subunit dehydrogenase involved in D-alanine esterification of teichoic acids
MQKAKVIITGRGEKALIETTSLINEQGGKCEYYIGDVTDVGDCQRIIDEVINKHSHLDVLINQRWDEHAGIV